MNLSYKKNGYISPIVALFIFFFISVPLVYWFITSGDKTPESVKGSSDIAAARVEGLSVDVTSEGTWDMYAYLCETSDECEDSLNAGKRVGVFSGGKVSKFTTSIPLDETWQDESVIKLYVKPGWGAAGRMFNAKAYDNFGVEVKSLENDGAAVNVLFVTVGNIRNAGSSIGEFSDR